VSGPARAALAVFVATLGIAAAACSSGDGAAPSTTAAPTSVTTTTVDRSSAPATSVTVFAQGESGYDTFRIPAVVAAANGTLLAFAEGRRGSANDAGDVDLVLKRSSDDGATWSPLQVLADDGANFVGNPSPVVDASTGRISVLATHKHGGDDEIEIVTGTSVETNKVWLIASTDDGTTWSTPADISATTMRPDWRWNTVGPGHATQLTTGPHAGRLVAAANHSTAGVMFGDHVLLSDDGGATWRIGAVDDSPGGPGAIWPDESTATQLPDGTVLFSSRDQDAAKQWHRLQTASTDGGQTFTAPYREQVGLVVPVVQGSLLWDATTERALFSAPMNQSDRVDLGVRASGDSGATWSEGTLISPGPSGYSDLVAVPGGRVGILHETGATLPWERIDFTVIGASLIR
jgi:sialidase-1